MAQVHAAQSRPGTVRSSWRIRFAYRDDDIWPIAASRTTMIAPGAAEHSGRSDPSKKEPERSGAWIELHSKERGAGWSRTISQPNRADVEAFADVGVITRIRTETATGEFEIIVPDLGPEAQFTLHASPAHKPEAAAQPRVVASLGELSRLERGQRPDRPDDDRPKKDGKTAD